MRFGCLLKQLSVKFLVMQATLKCNILSQTHEFRFWLKTMPKKPTATGVKKIERKKKSQKPPERCLSRPATMRQKARYIKL